MSTEQVPILTAKAAQKVLHDCCTPPNKTLEIFEQSMIVTIANGTATVIATAELEALRRDADRWAFYREHFHDQIDNCALHNWIGAKSLKFGGPDKTIDAAMTR